MYFDSAHLVSSQTNQNSPINAADDSSHNSVTWTMVQFADDLCLIVMILFIKPKMHSSDSNLFDSSLSVHWTITNCNKHTQTQIKNQCYIFVFVSYEIQSSLISTVLCINEYPYMSPVNHQSLWTSSLIKHDVQLKILC